MTRLFTILSSRFGGRNILNFASFFVSKALSLGLFAFAVSFFVRRSGAQLYGVVSLILVLYSYLQMVDMGMGYAVVYRLGRSVARGRSNGVQIVAEALPVYLLCGLTIGLVLILFSNRISNLLLGSGNYSTLLDLAGVGVFLLILSSLCVAVMQAFNRVYYVNLSRLIFDLIKAASLIIAVGTHNELTTVLLITVIGGIIKLCVDVFLASHLLGATNWLLPRFSFRSQWVNIKLGSPMFTSSLTFSVINSIDKIVVARLFSTATLAVYSIATDLHAKAYFLLWAVTGSLYTPFIHRQAKRQSVRGLLRMEALAIVGILTLYYVPLTVFAPGILRLWISADFSEKGYTLVRWMIVPTFMYMLSNPMEVYLQTAGEARRIGWVYIMALVVQLVGLAFLPQRFGVVGVILSQGMMHFTLLLCFLLLILNGRKAGLRHTEIPATLARESLV